MGRKSLRLQHISKRVLATWLGSPGAKNVSCRGRTSGKEQGPMASVVLIHWLGAALGAWPPGQCASTARDSYSRKGVGECPLCSQKVEKKCRKNEKTAHIYRCCGFIPHYTQQTQDNNIHTLTTNTITEKRSNIFVLALSITPLVKKKKKVVLYL